jgi:pimeloyl-ACP methyl ester carboxylesterase
VGLGTADILPTNSQRRFGTGKEITRDSKLGLEKNFMFVRRDLTDTVTTPSGNMHFVKKGSGYPVILLHPAGTSVWAWENVLETLSQSFACYAFDMMGHGDSDKPSRHFGIPDYAQALDQACQILNIHRAHVVGNSVGAVLAIETAASFPERVDKLVLVGCPVWDVYTAKERFRKGAQIDAQGMPTHQTLKTLIDATTFANPRQEWLDASNQLRTKAGLWYGKLWESLAHYNIMARLPRIQASSTMVLYGDFDRRFQEGKDLLHNNIVNSKRVILPGLGHIPQVEDPEAFLESLLPFLTT